MSVLHTVEAAVHKSINGGYRVKVSILDLGVYINGMMAFAPNDEHAEWAVYPPAQRAGRGKYARIVEFNKQLPLWELIYDACINAVKIEKKNEAEDIVPKDIVDMSDDEFLTQLTTARESL